MTWHEQNKEFNALINQLFQAEHWQDRAEAARKLGILKDGRATNLMCSALKKEKDKSVCNKIIEALGKIANPKATMIICDYLKNENLRSIAVTHPSAIFWIAFANRFFFSTIISRTATVSTYNSNRFPL